MQTNSTCKQITNANKYKQIEQMQIQITNATNATNAQITNSRQQMHKYNKHLLFAFVICAFVVCDCFLLGNQYVLAPSRTRSGSQEPAKA